ncbi:MAG TPA: Hpt domain-containing protein, partial [Herpetosiphonaceae bacterium]
QSEGEPDLVGQLIDLFAQESPPQVAAIARAVAEGDADSLRQTAHSLKSSAANLGAGALAAICAELEKRGRGGEAAGLEPQVAALETEFERACLALERVRTG